MDIKSSDRLVHIRDSNRYSNPPEIFHCKNFTWIYDRNPCDADITVFVDRRMTEASGCNSHVKIAWLLEPPVIDGFIYDYAVKNRSTFDAIVTYSKSLVQLGPPFVFYPYGTTWIDTQDRQIYEKSKLLSTIVSFKRHAPGHNMRHMLVDRFHDCMDVMGNGYRKIDNKMEGLVPYMYQMVAENSQYDDYFTEKIMDCFMTGVIPIYWGTLSIGHYFDSRGILSFSTIEDFARILQMISHEDYHSRLSYIQNNLQMAQSYADVDDNIWSACLNKYF